MCATLSLIFPGFKMEMSMPILEESMRQRSNKVLLGGGGENEDDDKKMVEPTLDGLWNMGLSL